MARVFKRLTPVEQVVSEILPRLRIGLSEEEVPLEEALGRYAARDVVARMDIPSEDRAVVDGYAVRSHDTQLASQTSPAVLRLAGRVLIGGYPSSPLGPGDAVEVSTGSPIPEGADAVVMLEHTRVEAGMVYVYRSVAPGYGVSRRGEDVKAGDLLVRRGARIRPWHIGLAAAQGYTALPVYREPCAAVLNVGEEVVEPGEPLGPGKIYDTTGYLVRSYLREMGLRVLSRGRVGDDEDAIERFYREALEECPFAFTIGGTSVGKKDYSARVLERLESVEYYVHGIALKPGRPAAVAVVGGKLAMALSGFPVAALAELQAVFEPAFHRALGLEEPVRPVVRARALRRIPATPGVRHIYRVRVYVDGEGSYYVEPLRLTGSGVLSALARGNGILVVPEDTTGVEEGGVVEVELIGPPAPLESRW